MYNFKFSPPTLKHVSKQSSQSTAFKWKQKCSLLLSTQVKIVYRIYIQKIFKITISKKIIVSKRV